MDGVILPLNYFIRNILFSRHCFIIHYATLVDFCQKPKIKDKTRKLTWIEN